MTDASRHSSLHCAVSRRTLLAGAGGLAGLVVLPQDATAQSAFPNRPITLVVPFAAGGSTDIVARLIAQQMSQTIGQQVIVENRAGAGGNTGAAAVAKASPDGYTILMGTISTHTLNPIMSKQKPYDPIADFEPISLLVSVPNVLVVHPSLPAKNLQELIALLKAEPGKYDYASSGNGTPLHVSGELFKSMTKTQMQHIPYRGGGPAMNDLVGGQVKIMFDNLPSSAQFIRGGTIRAIGVTTKDRVPGFEDIPTLAEQGLAGYETYSWNGLFAPAKTPAAIVGKLNADSNAAIADATIRQRLKDISATPVGSTPQALADHVKRELALWDPIIQGANITIN